MNTPDNRRNTAKLCEEYLIALDAGPGQACLGNQMAGHPRDARPL